MLKDKEQRIEELEESLRQSNRFVSAKSDVIRTSHDHHKLSFVFSAGTEVRGSIIAEQDWEKVSVCTLVCREGRSCIDMLLSLCALKMNV